MAAMPSIIWPLWGGVSAWQAWTGGSCREMRWIAHSTPFPYPMSRTGAHLAKLVQPYGGVSSAEGDIKGSAGVIGILWHRHQPTSQPQDA